MYHYKVSATIVFGEGYDTEFEDVNFVVISRNPKPVAFFLNESTGRIKNKNFNITDTTVIIQEVHGTEPV